MRLLIGVTGASGAIYAQRLLSFVAGCDEVEQIGLIYTQSAKKVWQYELKQGLFQHPKVTMYEYDDFFTEPASGSSLYSAMVIIPASMGTLGKLACSVSDNLLVRAADVMLKENKTLILVPRETPYNLNHLKNMEHLMLAGAKIVPASPSFYNHPQNIDDLVDTVVIKVINLLGLGFHGSLWGKNV